MALVLERLATTPAAVRRIMIAAMGSAVIPLVASVVAYAAGAPLLDRRAALDDGIKRVRGTFDQANGFSRYLLFIIIMGVALYPHLPKRWRLPMLVGIGGLGILMILTYTRSSWMALIIGLLVVGWLQSKKLLLALVVLGLGIALFVPSVVNRFSDLTANNGPSTALTGEGNSLAWRFSYWTDVVTLAADNPVTGIGLRVTEEMSRRRQAAPQRLRPRLRGDGRHRPAWPTSSCSPPWPAWPPEASETPGRLAAGRGGRLRRLLRLVRAREPRRQRDVPGRRALVLLRLRGVRGSGGQVRVDRQEERTGRPAGSRSPITRMTSN